MGFVGSIVIFLLLGVILPVTCLVVKNTVEKKQRIHMDDDKITKINDDTVLIEIEKNYKLNEPQHTPWVIIEEETQENKNDNEMTM